MSAEALAGILSWILPPLLGAIIGYVTNDIAIRMLFRPLKEIRVLGVRLPFTPGIIPKQRYALADSIGIMVSRELITEEVLRRQINTPEFRSRLRASVASLVDALAQTRFSRLREGGFAAFSDSLEDFLGESLARFFNSRSFIHASRALVGRLVRALSETPLERLPGSPDLPALVTRRLLPLLTGPQARRKAARSVARWLHSNGQAGTPLAAFIPEEVPGLLAGPLHSFLPGLLEALFRWLREDSTRLQMEERAKLLLRSALDRLNLLQKFIISAGAFDRTLEEKMPDILQDALDNLEEASREEENRRKIVEAVVQAFSRWRSRGLGEALGDDGERLAAAVEKILGFLDQERIREGIGRGLEKLARGQAGRPIGEVLARTLGIQESEIVDFASVQLLTLLSKRETSQAMARELLAFIRRFLEDSGDTSVGELLGLDAARRDAAADFLTERVIRILDRQLPELIQSFDFRGLVVKKINELNVADVERLLMIVIAKHLKWIDLFGAILGAAIGFGQLALRLLS